MHDLNQKTSHGVRLWAIGLIFLCLVVGMAAYATEPAAGKTSPADEARVHAISRDLRCLVCQSMSIDESESDFAHDVRGLVRERIVAGDTDAEVRAYIVARYGEYVLLSPPFKAATWALWLGPPVMAVIAVGATLTALRRKRRRGRYG